MKKTLLATLAVIIVFVAVLYYVVNPLSFLRGDNGDSVMVFTSIFLIVMVVIFPLVLMKSTKPKISKMEGVGRGLCIGGLLSIVYSAFDLFVIKKSIVSGCSDWCGMENVIIGIISVMYILLGGGLWLVGRFMYKKK